jgi:NAD(P) transhydrogenase subunit alpha
LLAEDASELYAKNQYNLLALFMKDNIVEIDWDDEILAKTVLTHGGQNKAEESDLAQKTAIPTKPPIKAGHSKHASTKA